MVGFGTCPGWSGGPLLNAKAEVCGLLNSSDGRTSVFVSSAAVRNAYEATRPRATPPDDESRPRLYVFSSKSCAPCRQFQHDFDNRSELRTAIEAAFRVEFVEIDERPDVAQRFGITRVPVFAVPGRDPIVGYEGVEELLIALGLKPAPVDRTPSEPEPVDPPPDEVAVKPAPPTTPAADETPTAKTVPKRPPEKSAPPVTPQTESLDRLSGLVEQAITVATWLGVGGLSGGTGGLILGGIALWRTLRTRRRRAHPVRDPPAAESSLVKPPPVLTVDSPPPPQAILTETRFAPYERDTFSQAFSWAETELARKYPGAVGTLESLRGLINQFLAAKAQ